MPVTKKKETYSEAMARLEKIVSQIDNNELEIDDISGSCPISSNTC